MATARVLRFEKSVLSVEQEERSRILVRMKWEQIEASSESLRFDVSEDRVALSC